MLKWGVVGVGRAGQARTRALHQDPRSEPIYGMRGQPAAVGLRSVSDLGEILRFVHAVAICTPDTTHANLVRMALAADRHVVVEFPLAGSAEVAADLLHLAAQRGRVLHVEHIELLGGAARVLREGSVGRTLRSGSVRFTGGCRKGTYGIASANVARLHRLVDAVGLPDAVQLKGRSPRHLDAWLRYGDAVVTLDFRHGDDLPRSTVIRLELDEEGGGSTVLEQQDGAVTQDGRPLATPPVRPLFLQDQLVATARILDGAEPYVSDQRLLEVLSLADALVRASPDGGWTEWTAVAPRG